MAKKYFERRSVALALEDWLTDAGWNTGKVEEGFQSEETIRVPMVSIYFLPSRYVEKQLGRSTTTEKSFTRRVQVDCYMESEPRADAISDDVGEFFDQMFINITDPSGSILGNIYCPDSETILLDTIPPVMSEVKVKRWRSVIQATLESNYVI